MRHANRLDPARLPDVLRTAEVAVLLRVSKPTVLRMAKDGSIPVCRIGPKTLRYPKDAVVALISEAEAAEKADDGDYIECELLWHDPETKED